MNDLIIIREMPSIEHVLSDQQFGEHCSVLRVEVSETAGRKHSVVNIREEFESATRDVRRVSRVLDCTEPSATRDAFLIKALHTICDILSPKDRMESARIPC